MIEPKSSEPEARTHPAPGTFIPGFRVESPDDAQRHPSPADHWRPDSRPQNVQGGAIDIGSEPFVGNRPGSVIPGVGSYTGNLPGYDPVYFPEPPADPVRQALDEIARIYGLDPFRPTGLSSRPASSIRTNNTGDGAREDYPPVNGLDPRYILPANTGAGGMRPPPPPPKPPASPPQPIPQPRTAPTNHHPQQTQTHPSNTHSNPPSPISPQNQAILGRRSLRDLCTRPADRSERRQSM